MEPRHEPATDPPLPSPRPDEASARRDRRSGGGLVRPKRLLAFLLLALIAPLDACRQFPEVMGNADRELQFDICEAALAQPLEKRAYQGLEGWFFFTLDLKETYPLFEQTAFFAELSARLGAQGVSLVLLPVTGRALVRPDTLYLGDPLQVNFDPREAEGIYKGFLDGLRAGGVDVFDTLAAARAFDAGGGQTFFRRDLHWRSEGANAVFRGVADFIRSLEPDLPAAAVTLNRGPSEAQHRGQFVNNWTSGNCGYLLPAEPHGVYTVTPAGDASSEVVLVGSSFSIPPYGYDFLAAALQSRVYNAAVGSGGAKLSLERYLGSAAYRGHKPRVLVWEFPVYAYGFSPDEQAQLLGLVD